LKKDTTTAGLSVVDKNEIKESVIAIEIKALKLSWIEDREVTLLNREVTLLNMEPRLRAAIEKDRFIEKEDTTTPVLSTLDGLKIDANGCTEDGKPFLLKKRYELLTRWSPYPPPRTWVEGVVPPRPGMTKEIFLRTLSRGCDQYIDKFKTWDDMFLMSGNRMRQLKIPIEQRRWILHWVERYRQGVDPVWIPKNKSRGKKNLNEKKARGGPYLP